MRWPLRNQMLVPFAGVILAAVTLVSVLNAWLAAHRAERQLESQLRRIVATLQNPAFPLTESVLQQARGLSGAEFVVTEEAGRVLAATLVDPPALPVASPPSSSAPSPSSHALGAPALIGGERYFHSVLELAPGGASEKLRRLHILLSERTLRESRWQSAYPSLLVGAAALVVAGLIALTLASRLSAPLVGLTRQVAQMAAGQFGALPLPARDDELRDLAASVNTLAEELTRMKQAVQRAERLATLGQLSGGLAHDLRNDITGARLAVQLHQRSCQNDPQTLAVALRQLSLTEEHLQRLLTLGQPTPLQRKSLDLREVIWELVSLLAPACLHKNVQLQAPSPMSPLPLTADAGQLRQMLLNLALNGIEAAGPGGWVRIEAEQQAATRRVLVRVLDSGPGPPQEIIARLFEPFVTSKPEGIGLGLAVARQIAQSHGGELDYSRPGATCFQATLPAD